jgi:phenylacetic acid degradation operon negative regulatory protein
VRVVPNRERQVHAGSASFALLTVLGEFVWPQRGSVRTSTLLHALRGLGVEEKSARQAVNRASAAGWLDGERVGREVRWTLTDEGRRVLRGGARRVLSVGQGETAWSGEWLVLLVTVPNAQRAVRRRLHSRLSWAGFGSPQPGMWVNPHPERADEAARIVGALGLAGATWSFVGPSAAVGLGDDELVRRAWDLDAIAARGHDLVATYSALSPAPGDDTLLTHLRLLLDWYRLPFDDPQLPDELLPNWAGRQVASQLEALRTRWRDGAHARWNEIEDGAEPDRASA